MFDIWIFKFMTLKEIVFYVQISFPNTVIQEGVGTKPMVLPLFLMLPV